MKLFKNVDIFDLQGILEKGILSLKESGNDNWEGRRAPNSDEVVYLFEPLTDKNVFEQYGAVLLEVDVDNAQESDLMQGDVNKGLYKEYVCDRVEPNQIKNIYFPKIFKDRLLKLEWLELSQETLNKISFVDMTFDICSPQENDFETFKNTAAFSSEMWGGYLRGTREDRTVIDIDNVKYLID